GGKEAGGVNMSDGVGHGQAIDVASVGTRRVFRGQSVHGLEGIFQPQTVAVIGASPKAGSVGRTVLENLLTSESERALYAVNPKYNEVLGVPAFPDVGSLPEPPDLAVICTPAATVPDIVRGCGQAGTRGLIVVSAGFREVGETGRRLE